MPGLITHFFFYWHVCSTCILNTWFEMCSLTSTSSLQAMCVILLQSKEVWESFLTWTIIIRKIDDVTIKWGPKPKLHSFSRNKVPPQTASTWRLCRPIRLSESKRIISHSTGWAHLLAVKVSVRHGVVGAIYHCWGYFSHKDYTAEVQPTSWT